MDEKTPQKPVPPANLLTEMAKRKADAQKAGLNVGHFNKGKPRYQEKARPFTPPGGRNGQGKP